MCYPWDMLAAGSSATLWREAIDSRTNEHVRRWMRHFPALRATSLERWVDAFGEAAVPAACRLLEPAERDLLVDEVWRRSTERSGHSTDEFSDVIDTLEEGVRACTDRSEVGAAFVRLGTRAPTDSPLAQEGGLQVDGGTEALEVLLQSPRVFDDLCLYQECGHVPSIAVRPWLDIAPWAELRAFVRGRRLVGLTQRRVDRVWGQLAARAGEVEASVRARCEALASLWPQDDVIVDLVVDDEALVLDLHPFVPLVDAGLFGWEEPGLFDRFAFRFLK